MKLHSGFTLLETALSITFLGLIAILITVQVLDYEAYQRDNTRKSAINAIHYALENDFYKSHNYYPETISELNLPTAGATAFTDPSGRQLGTAKSDYFYEPAHCEQGRCYEYTLWANLEKESAFIKTNL